MPVLLYKLNQVPPDEAEAMRNLLDEAAVPFYETSQGFWGFSLAAFWLADQDAEEEQRALSLIGEYQRQRGEQARAEYRPKGLFAALWEKPLKLVLLVVVALILYFSITPFIGLVLGPGG